METTLEKLDINMSKEKMIDTINENFSRVSDRLDNIDHQIMEQIKLYGELNNFLRQESFSNSKRYDDINEKLKKLDGIDSKIDTLIGINSSKK